MPLQWGTKIKEGFDWLLGKRRADAIEDKSVRAVAVGEAIVEGDYEKALEQLELEERKGMVMWLLKRLLPILPRWLDDILTDAAVKFVTEGHKNTP